MKARFFCFFLALSACATDDVLGRSTIATPVRFPSPAAAAELPHRSLGAAEAEPVFRALSDALPARDTYEIASLSCVHIAFPSQRSTHCRVDDARIDDSAKATALMEAIVKAGAQHDRNGKMPNVTVKKVRATRDALVFDDAANAKEPRVPNQRLTGAAAEEAMSALARGGVKEDDGALLVVCTAFTPDPECFLRGASGTKLDKAQSLSVWKAFVHSPTVTVLNASHFSWDGTTLAFVGVFDSVSPPPSVPSAPSPASAP